MRPIGWKKMFKEENSWDKMPAKSIKKWKRGSKHKTKMLIKKELNYDIIEDFEKEYQIRMEQEDETN